MSGGAALETDFPYLKCKHYLRGCGSSGIGRWRGREPWCENLQTKCYVVMAVM